MVSSQDNILSAIEKLVQQNEALQKTLDRLQRDSSELHHDYTNLVEVLEVILADKTDNKNITWSAKVISDKTNIPLKQIKKAMRTGELASIPIHKRGKGYVRVASPENVNSWLRQKENKQEPSPAKTRIQPHRRKPPNVVF